MIIQIKNGQIQNLQAFQNVIETAKDGEYILKQYKRTRSEEQNRYYRGLLGIVEKETGQDKDDIHEKMRMKFLTVPGSGKSLPFCRSTAKLSTSDFCEYIENIKNFMAEFGIILPTAEEFENYILSTDLSHEKDREGE